jgi:hypothetical protein
MKQVLLAAPLFMSCALFIRSLVPEPGFTNIPVGLDPCAIATADLNRDNILDLVTANITGNGISVLLGRGDGSFQPVLLPHPGAGLSPGSLVIADLDGNTVPDIATANRDDDSVTVLIGNGDGTFREPISFPVGASPVSIGAADLDGDGAIDLVTANQGDESISILLNGSSGLFGKETRLPVSGAPIAIITGDFNIDGRPDLVAAHNNTNNASLFFGNGSATFDTERLLDVGAPQIDAASEDLRNDEDFDLIFLTASSIVVISNSLVQEDGTPGTVFENPLPTVPNAINPRADSPSALAVGKLHQERSDVDTNSDVVYADPAFGLNIMQGLGTGVFQFDPNDDGSEIIFLNFEGPTDVLIADFNKDEKPDLATANLDNSVSVLLGF